MVAVIAVLLLVSSLASTCGKKAVSEKDWPTGELAQMLPKMDRKCESVFESKDSLDIRVGDRASKSDYDAYVASCKEKGFTYEAEEGSEDYRAFNSEGYLLELSFADYGEGKISISLDAPKAAGDLAWPKSGLAALLPDPDKSKGSVKIDSASQFSAYVGDVTREEFDAYVDKCIDLGFSVEYSRYDDVYEAEDASGNSLWLEYLGFATMQVCLDASDESDESGDAPLSSSAISQEPEPEPSEQASDGGIDPDFKEAMDSYETFMDGYIEFMGKYSNSSDAASMLVDYAKWMSDYNDTVKKLDAIDTSVLNDAEMAYYVEVTTRVSGKLAAAAL